VVPYFRSAEQPAQIRQDKHQGHGENDESGLADFWMFEHGTLPMVMFFLAPTACRNLS
jgi:hypothetical protein